MKIQIEDYFGNDVIKLDFCQIHRYVIRKYFDSIGDIVIKNGYSIADIDTDEEGEEYIRIQQDNVDNSSKEEIDDRLNLIKDLYNFVSN